MNIIDKRASNPAAALNGTELVYVGQAAADAVTTVLDMQTFITNGFLLISTAASTYATTSSLTSGLLANLTPTINTQTGTSYTLLTADNDGKSYVRMTNASANTVTITTALTKPVSISQRGAGTTILVAGAGVTLNGTLAFTAQHQTKTVVPIGSGVYDVVG